MKSALLLGKIIMFAFHTDLDNTLIYSYKHDIGIFKKNVEKYNGKEISFITNNTYTLLNEIQHKMLIVPTTTRTIEQFKRIELGINPFQYALVCNGGVLLENGEINKTWYKESKSLVAESNYEMERGYSLLNYDTNRCFELRYIEDMFLFTKSRNPAQTVNMLNNSLNLKKVNVYHNGEKIYILPLKLSKGNAVMRFKEYMGLSKVIAAGDSEFDISMVTVANFGLVPSGFKKRYLINSAHVKEMDDRYIFSEQLLTECIKIASLYK